ncbi:zinc finger protein OZF-like isoform X2 [Maniola hyperantus]|uniref:zinc finger protein OZF-like isoform X2 n=1 Tax=Aphantopus hyperantus TaxID=2795564 RepID=UPI00156A4CAE|nr:zinc finger protein 260-like isoform X1 [Maniola hyperantus]XP_034838002.1 zinc finger protein 260-like isoform X2 [Maniola hyperantus]
MNVKKGKGPVFDPGLCRCCGMIKKCRVLNVEYESLGQLEIYSDMIMDCYGLLLSHLDDKLSERLVCATCVQRLRDALAFKLQVLQCEAAFLQARLCADSPETDAKAGESDSKIEVEVKMEPPDEPEPDRDALADHASYETKPLEDAAGYESSNEDVPLQVLVSEKPHRKPRVDCGSILKRTIERPKIPMSKLQQRMRERDPSYITETNTLTIVEFSYVCPFKCRHSHLLCFYCGESFSDPQLLRSHTLETHHPKKFKVTGHKNMLKVDLTRIDCRLCPEKISSLEEFKKHITSVHNKKYYFNSREMILPFRLSKHEYKCALCDAAFAYFHALNKHMNEHYSNFMCETCGLGFVDRARFLMHQQRHDQGDFPCRECGKVFRAQYNRELHVDRVHRKRGRVYCPKCDVRLMTYPQKLKHLKEVHGEAPMAFPCNMCDKICESRRQLTIHGRKAHLKDYRYECQCCGQKFFTRFALTNHMPTHTGERNYKCKVCEKTYPRLKTLKDHIRIHTNDRRYRCHVCGQAFIQNCSLKGHMKTQHPEYS